MILQLDVKAAEEKPAQVTTNNDDVPDDNNQNAVFDVLPASEKDEFAAPLNISFGDKRRAMLYMPIDATKEDAEYVRDMISLMFKRVYKVE